MIKPITEEEFHSLETEFPYYEGRWRYQSRACSIASELIAKYRLTTALELGPLMRPVIVGADAMDFETIVRLDPGARLIQHNASVVPWPIQKRYGLFVALQVFEHLDSGPGGVRIPGLFGIQKVAFKEVIRIADHAIISLPIDWIMEDERNCHCGITEEVALSWFAPTMPSRMELGNEGPFKRLMYVFENLGNQSVDRADARTGGD